MGNRTGQAQGAGDFKEYANGGSDGTTWAGASFADWVQVIGAGTTVVTTEAGAAAQTPYNRTITTDASEPAAVVHGAFTALVSTTATRVRMGVGPSPLLAVPATGLLSGSALSTAVTAFTAKTNADAAMAEIYQTLETAQGVIPIDPCNGFLVAGTPMAAFADNAASAPGVTVDNSKAAAVRWNDAATQVAVWCPQVPLPMDMDVTKGATFVVLASKSGATGGDATTFDVACYQQTAAALEDAGSNLGGTTTALVGAATAKTVSKLTLAIAANTFTAPPGNLSISIKPTNGLAGTDDIVCNGFYLQYQKKLLTT